MLSVMVWSGSSTWCCSYYAHCYRCHCYCYTMVLSLSPWLSDPGGHDFNAWPLRSSCLVRCDGVNYYQLWYPSQRSWADCYSLLWCLRHRGSVNEGFGWEGKSRYLWVAGKTVKSLYNMRHTWASLQWRNRCNINVPFLCSHVLSVRDAISTFPFSAFMYFQ